MSALTRWNDDRLDDLASRVEAVVRQHEAMIEMRTEMVEVRTRLENVSGDTGECIAELRSLKRDLEKRAMAQHDERKADRRWMVGTLIATAGLIVAALAIFLG